MAKFITTTEISYQIELIIKEAKTFIFLCTPFIQLHERLKSIIEEKLSETSVHLIVVCREKELQLTEREWLNLFPKVHLLFEANLHGKCYFNESRAILSSMNLYTYSMINNNEFGMLINKKEDTENFDLLFKECNRLSKKKLQAIIKEIIKEIEEQEKYRQQVIHQIINARWKPLEPLPKEWDELRRLGNLE